MFLHNVKKKRDKNWQTHKLLQIICSEFYMLHPTYIGFQI